MYNLVNANFNRTYNPSGTQNALSDIKRLLTCRDVLAQKKACGCIVDVISRYNRNSTERARMVEYLLDNDITVFLCEATSNLDFDLFVSILNCIRLLWTAKRFFSEEHAAHCMAAVVRNLAHYTSSGLKAAIDACLNFLDGLLNGIEVHQSTAALSHQSAYSAVQLLACLNALPSHISSNPNSILSSALVLHALISYQPEDVIIKSSTATVLVEVLKKWFQILMGSLNHSFLVVNGLFGMFYVVLCQLGLDVLRLQKLLTNGTPKTNFVQDILTDEQEMNILKQCAKDMWSNTVFVLTELVVFTKDHQNQLETEEYSVFLKFLLTFFYESNSSDSLSDFCDMLFTKGYLIMLPNVQTVRKDISVRKSSTLILGEMLKVLSEKYLNIESQSGACNKDINMGLVELQNGIENPQGIGVQLQKCQSYSLLIYIYFYCQSSENPEESTAPLLPYLVEHMLRLPKGFKPPAHIIKALWLVFAMSTISNGSLDTLEDRVYLEKAIDRIIVMLHPDPSIYYTHNPALLLWAFTSLRIPNYVKLHILSQWLKIEHSFPTELILEPTLPELLLNVLIQNKDSTIVENCMTALRLCVDSEGSNELGDLIWTMLPNVLSRGLIDDSCLETNVSYLLDLATSLLPSELDQTICVKIAVLLTALFSKNDIEYSGTVEDKYRYEYVCLKLCLYLLGLANNQNDNRVLLTYINRTGFLPRVLLATNSVDDKVACASLQLLSYIVHYFNKNNYQPKAVLQLQTNLIIQSLKKDSNSERGASLLQLIYMVLNSGANTPLSLSYDIGTGPCEGQQCNALRALMLRIQLMLCSRESKTQISAGWKTLSMIFKHAIVSKNDTKLVAILTSQPWTHVLIQYQLSQSTTLEFITFLQNWLTLLKITLKKSQEEKKTQLNKQSLVVKTLIMIKKNTVTEEELKETNQKVQVIVKEILEESKVRIKMIEKNI